MSSVNASMLLLHMNGLSSLLSALCICRASKGSYNLLCACSHSQMLSVGLPGTFILLIYIGPQDTNVSSGCVAVVMQHSAVLLNMTFRQEVALWWSPGHLQTAQVPEIGTKAPTSDRLKLPAADTNPTLITFLRHCGCPCKPAHFRYRHVSH